MTFDLPGEKVNKFSRTVMKEFEEILPKLQKLAATGEIDALVLLSGKPGNFIAGADIEMFGEVQTEEEATQLSAKGQEILNRWEDLSFVKVVGIDGTCLGGGCELALASDAIVLSKSKKTKIGLPEVLLGIVPGMGGCIRMPWRIGLANSLDLILSSKQLDGDRAARMGLADASIAEENFEGSVLAWTQKQLKKLQAGERLGRTPKLGGMGGAMGSLLEGTPFGRGMIFSQAQKTVMKRTHGHYPAPLEVIRVIQKSGTGFKKRSSGKKRDRAMAMEAAAFGKCAVTDVSRNLVRLFFMTEAIKKSHGLPGGKTLSTPPVQTAGVLGAGTMGGGIAQLLADKGITARMKDLNHEALEIGIQAAASIFKKKLKRRRINQRQYIQGLNRIVPLLDYSGFQSLDTVIEAVVEKMEIKKSVFKELEERVSDDCVLASNTSSLSINEMQTVLRKPERFVGMHFFNPVSKMPLIEVIRGQKTSDEAVVTIFELSKKMGKYPIVVQDGAGFLVNRLLVPYLNEAIYLLSEGAPVEELDRALLNFGMPMGPMELIDEVGVDVGDHVLKILHDAFGERMVPAPITDKVVQAGRLGKKTQKGIYRYDGPPGRLKKELDPEIYQVIGVKPQSKKFDAETMVQRCVLPMINEAARCLDDRIVESPEDVDLGMIMGTGFPPFRGGLLRYADSIGAKKLLEWLKKYEAEPGCGKRFTPSERLTQMAASGQTFYP